MRLSQSMKTILRRFPAVVILFAAVLRTQASSVIPLGTGELVAASGAIFRATVAGGKCVRDGEGLIVTRTTLRVSEVFKGKVPSVVRVAHRGGELGNENEFFGLSPQFAAGEECLLFVRRRADGQLECTQGSVSAVRLIPATGTPTGFGGGGGTWLAELRQLTSGGILAGEDVTDQSASITTQAATGMLGGIAARFLQPDRGEPIPYLIDATSLPAGISFTQATNAVQQALNAWAAVTSLKFKLEGIQSFGQGADTITGSDEKLRIQLHDNYNRINTVNVLGIGGRNGQTSPVSGVGWDLGGNIAGNEFRKTTRGFVVLEATNSSMQVLATFAETLCHEIGHALSLAHSSENPSEPNTTLKQAIMYYTAHADGRGATLGAYDPPVIQQAYPVGNTAPFTYNRVLDVVSPPDPPNVPGINEAELRACDLQTPALTLETAGESGLNGSFTTVGTLFKYTPAGYYSDSSRFDPAGSAYYDIIYARFSDGTNSSPYAVVRVVSFNEDSGEWPSPSDGLPDTWMTTHFGHLAPQSGDKSRAQDDKDNDGLRNLDEFRAGMTPTDNTSAQRITLLSSANLEWQAKAYELYEVQVSTNLTTWTRYGWPVLPTNSTGSITIARTNPAQHFRIVKVP